MNKLVLACAIALSCSTVCLAKSGSKAHSLVAQADAEPVLRGAIPPRSTTTSGTATSTSPSTSSVSSPSTVESTTTSSTTTTQTPSTNPADPSSTTTTTTTTKKVNPRDVELQNELKAFDATPPSNELNTMPLNALQGTANITDIEVTARNLKDCPLQRDHDKGLKYVEVTVKNSGQNIAVILGNSAHADLGTVRLATAPASDAEESDLPRLSGKGKLAVGVVAAFSLGYAAPIFYENLTKEQHAKRYLGEAIGRDGSRREVEAGHFGVRVIMPGDETTGWIAFRAPRNQDLKNIVIPVSYTRSAVPAGSVTVPLSDATAN